MEKLTKEQIEDIADDLNNFDFLPVTPDGVEEKERICKGVEQMRDELLAYRQLAEQIGCPLEVFIKAILNGIYTDIVGSYFDDDFWVKTHWDGQYPCFVFQGQCRWVKSCDYKKSWWLKADKSE